MLSVNVRVYATIRGDWLAVRLAAPLVSQLARLWMPIQSELERRLGGLAVYEGRRDVAGWVGCSGVRAPSTLGTSFLLLPMAARQGLGQVVGEPVRARPQLRVAELICFVDVDHTVERPAVTPGTLVTSTPGRRIRGA
jgi:hypothetical protein